MASGKVSPIRAALPDAFRQDLATKVA